MTFEEAFSFESLLKAHQRCRISKQHKKEVINFELAILVNLHKLATELLDGTYTVGRYRQFSIKEPKERVIECLSYRDRIVLMALCTNLIEPKFERHLIYDNVACRKGRGTSFGLNRLAVFMRDYYRKHGLEGYVLKCDISKYFNSINHTILLKQIERLNFDAKTFNLIKMIVNSKEITPDTGLPAGNQTSQWFGLLYLNQIDRLIKESFRIKYYVRYMDDFILIHNDKEYLKQCRETIEQFAAEKLNLTLNDKTQISRIENGVDFLGFLSTLTPTGKVIRKLRQSSKKRMKMNLKTLLYLKRMNLVDDDYINCRIISYKAHIKKGHALKCYSKMVALFREKLNKYD